MYRPHSYYYIFSLRETAREGPRAIKIFENVLVLLGTTWEVSYAPLRRTINSVTPAN